MAKLRMGSRGSQLAVWQANHVAELLRKRGHEVSIEIIKTTGDKILDVPLAKIGGKGLFTKEIDEALLDGRIDLAVHSMKDVPFQLPDGIDFGAIPEREDPRDAFISNGPKLQELAPGATIGTSSTATSGQRFSNSPLVQFACQSASALPRVPSLSLGAVIAI